MNTGRAEQKDFIKNASKAVGKELTRALLDAVEIGIGFVAGKIRSPNDAVYFLERMETKQRRAIGKKLYDLRRLGYVGVKEEKYILTPKGKRFVDEERLWRLRPKEPKEWDGIWRVVLFDIPAKKYKARRSLRLLLREIGCVQYQDSVLVHPHDIFPIVVKITQFYGITRNVDTIETRSLTREGFLRKHFNV
jgi:hypothetical protein